jgi:hypothetical protein
MGQPSYKEFSKGDAKRLTAKLASIRSKKVNEAKKKK